MGWFKKNQFMVANEISKSMGKPVIQAAREVDTMIARCENLCRFSREALEDDVIQVDSTNYVKIKKEPIGIAFMISPWNYPLLTVVNSLVAAILCGNPILLKHSVRTPTVGDYFEQAFKSVGATNVVQHLFLDGKDIPLLYNENKINFVGFTGSVETGRTVLKNIAASNRFIHQVFELGGKDPAYIREDADLEFAAANVVDGATYNSGQSCCSIERAYVHESVYDKFIDLAIKEVEKLSLGDPAGKLKEGKKGTSHEDFDYPSMGPMALADSVMFIKEQVEKAGEAGAEVVIGGSITNDNNGKGRFFEPTIIKNCDNSMEIMQLETFGPILPICKVSSDNEAIDFMNDSQFGLTAAVYSKDYSTVEKLCANINHGTVFLNRCDSLDPRLPWSGRKNSGVGIGLSKYGFNAFYRTKGYNFNLPK